MTTNQNPVFPGQPNPPQVSVLGIIFFILGAPHLYGFLKRRAARPKPLTPVRYAMLALLAGAIASVLEMSLL